MKNSILVSLVLCIIQISYGQSNAFNKQLAKHEEELKKNFPRTLTTPFPKSTLGDKLQILYEMQAKEPCGIIRTDKRLYIPSQIVSEYGEQRLRTTSVFEIPLSSTNLMFLIITPSDITKITNGTFNEEEYIKAKRIIGINDNLVNFGQAVLTPISGFPSLFYQKSCGSYFSSDISGKVKAPLAELEASLAAETNKSTSITTVTGHFFSPLYLILRQNTPQSTYAHLLIWEAYWENHRNNPTATAPLHKFGKYVSEMKGTITNRSINSDEIIKMNSRFSTNISLGMLSTNGNFSGGLDSKTAFELKGFDTYIHKLGNGNLSWDVIDLPRIAQINQKLQNSINFKAHPPIDGLANYLLPTEITRILVGVPSSLCDSDSWEISPDGYNKSIWKEKPTVVSNHVSAKENQLPECICKITGFIRKDVIENAVKNNGVIELSLNAENKKNITGQKLSLNIAKPTVKVTDNPKINYINSASINASIGKTEVGNKMHYHYPIQFTINSTGIQLTEPYKISNIQIEYINKESEANPLSVLLDNFVINGNSVNLIVRSSEKPISYIKQGEIVVPIKIKFNIEIRGGTTTQLVTNTINLQLPNLVPELDLRSNMSEGN